jgi:hypothetical protein
MSTPIPDLWPDDIDTVNETSPVAILSEQAAALGKRTNNVVTAEIQPLKAREEGRLLFSFNLVAPFLNNFRFQLFRVSHEVIQMYPVRFINMLKADSDGKYESVELPDKEAFYEKLRSIFSHTSVRSAIASLRAQSEVAPADDIPF